MKRFLVDWVGNYVFFVPIVLASNGWNWPMSAVVTYLLTSLVIAGFAGRAFTLFLKHLWYPLWMEKF